jgi:Tol biopolymer transport system component
MQGHQHARSRVGALAVLLATIGRTGAATVLALLGFLVVLWSAGDARPGNSLDIDQPVGATITFSRQASIYSVSDRGTGLRLILRGTPRKREFGQPAWSRDGKRLAVTETTYPSHRETDVAVVDGRRVQSLAEGGRSSQHGRAAWAPDGKRIVAVGYALCLSRFCGGQLFLTGPGTGRATLVGRPRSYDSRIGDDAPSWSPDGKWLVFPRFVYHGYVGVSPRLYLIHPDGSGLRRLTTAYGTNPSWSPDGHLIVFDNGRGINIVRADGSATARITRPLTWDADPAWSPDGREIAFVRGESRDRTGLSDLWVMRPDGSHLRLVVKNATAPAWRVL